MRHLRPIYRNRAVDVIQSNRENSFIKGLHFAGDAVSILHDKLVSFLSREKRNCKEERTTENNGSDIHGSSILMFLITVHVETITGGRKLTHQIRHVCDS